MFPDRHLDRSAFFWRKLRRTPLRFCDCLSKNAPFSSDSRRKGENTDLIRDPDDTADPGGHS